METVELNDPSQYYVLFNVILWFLCFVREWKERFKRPATSVRNTRVMKTTFFCWENLPYIMCSSTIAFISGAAM